MNHCDTQKLVVGSLDELHPEWKYFRFVNIIGFLQLSGHLCENTSFVYAWTTQGYVFDIELLI